MGCAHRPTHKHQAPYHRAYPAPTVTVPSYSKCLYYEPACNHGKLCKNLAPTCTALKATVLPFDCAEYTSCTIVQYLGAGEEGGGGAHSPKGKGAAKFIAMPE